MIYTEGEFQNSYVSIEDANVLALTMKPSFLEPGDAAQLDHDDEAVLIEAAQDLEHYWRWSGVPAADNQVLAWPRAGVERPGSERPGCPGWSVPYSYEAALLYKMNYLMPGLSPIKFLPADTVPLAVRQAQVLLALLRKAGKTLFEDTEGNTQGLQLDTGFKIAYSNPTRAAIDITKRLAGLGWFIGDELARV